MAVAVLRGIQCAYTGLCTQREEEGCKEHKTDKVSPSFFVNKTEQREVHTEEVKVLETLDRILERD